jgi:hypothetical protein
MALQPGEACRLIKPSKDLFDPEGLMNPDKIFLAD